MQNCPRETSVDAVRGVHVPYQYLSHDGRKPRAQQSLRLSDAHRIQKICCCTWVVFRIMSVNPRPQAHRDC
jgi:hypothetical protein